MAQSIKRCLKKGTALIMFILLGVSSLNPNQNFLKEAGEFVPPWDYTQVDPSIHVRYGSMTLNVLSHSKLPILQDSVNTELKGCATIQIYFKPL